MAAYRFFNAKARRTFVLASDKALPEAERTSFVLRPLTVHDEQELASELDGVAGAARPLAYAISVVRRALVDWTNMRDQSGAQVALERGADGHVSSASIDGLGRDALLELFVAVMRGEELEPAEAGKS
jgi:hypothetical protein